MLYFDEESHTYMLENDILKSVSHVVASQFKPFNARIIAATLERTKGNDPESRYYKMNREDIIQQWAIAGKDAREAGTKLHLQIENFFRYDWATPETPSREWNHFADFITDHPDWVLIGCEVKVHNHKIAGTIDAVFKTNDGNVLVDWKRCKSIDFSGHGRGIDEMMYVEDCNFNKYSLQLSLYRQLIDIPISSCYIVQLHPELDTYFKYKAQNFHMEAKRLIN